MCLVVCMCVWLDESSEQMNECACLCRLISTAEGLPASDGQMCLVNARCCVDASALAPCCTCLPVPYTAKLANPLVHHRCINFPSLETPAIRTYSVAFCSLPLQDVTAACACSLPHANSLQHLAAAWCIYSMRPLMCICHSLSSISMSWLLRLAAALMLLLLKPSATHN